LTGIRVYGIVTAEVEMVKTSHRGVKTTVEIPEKLWERAKRRALDERTDLRTLILEGLELRLKEAKR
jgi:hypothetical protein